MTESRDDWADLLRAANRGDTAAYTRFLVALAPVLRGIVRARAGGIDAGLQEDIVQEVLLTIHLKRHTWAEDRPVRPWVYAITRYKIIDALRRTGRVATLPVEDFLDILPAAADADPFVRRDTDRMLDQLDDRSRNILRAVAYEGTKLADLGSHFGLSEGAARVALHRALGKLSALRRKDQ
jgi:RNA polymerase sigma-70 factor (ECF subfamily)